MSTLVGTVGFSVGTVGFSVGSVSHNISTLPSINSHNVNEDVIEESVNTSPVHTSSGRSRLSSASSSSDSIDSLSSASSTSSSSTSSSSSNLDMSIQMEDLSLSQFYVVDNPTNGDSATIRVPRARLEELEYLNENLGEIIKAAIKEDGNTVA